MKTAIIRTSIWKDDQIYELNLDTKLLFLFLSTSPERNNTRFYQMSDRLISAYIGLTDQALKTCKEQLQQAGLIAFYENWVIIGNESFASPTKGKLSSRLYEEDLAKVPAQVQDFAQEWLLSGSCATQDYGNGNGNGDGNGSGKENVEVEVLESKRQRDPYWDTICEVCSIDPDKVTRSLAGLIGKVVKEIKQVCDHPDEIYEKAKIWQILHPEIPLTPPALAKHWPMLNQQRVATISTQKTRNEKLRAFEQQQTMNQILSNIETHKEIHS